MYYINQVILLTHMYYRGIRRRTQQREEYMTQQNLKDSADAEFAKRLNENKDKELSKTAKKRAKRQKKKERVKQIRLMSPAEREALAPPAPLIESEEEEEHALETLHNGTSEDITSEDVTSEDSVPVGCAQRPVANN